MTDNEGHYRALEKMYLSAANNAYYEPEVSISHQTCRISFPVKPTFFHAGGAVHGSVLFKMLDDSAFFAANSVIQRVFVLTVSYTVYFLRPVSAGVLVAEGILVHRSKRLLIAESKVREGESGKVIARGNGTFMPSRIALDEKVGYFLNDS